MWKPSGILTYIYIYTFIVYNYLYDILNDIIIIVIYSS